MGRKAKATGSGDLDKSPDLKKAGTKAFSDNPKDVNWMQLMRAIWTLSVPFFTDRISRLKANALFWGTVGLTFFQVWIVLKISGQAKDMQNALHKHKPDVFWAHIRTLVLIVLCLGPMTMLHRFLAGTLALEWRRYLTNRIFSKYINSEQAFYRLKMMDASIDNPDQRIGQDVCEFTEMTVFLIEHFLRDIGTVLSSTMLVYHISPETCYLLFGFSIFYTLIMLKGFASPLMRVQRRVLGLEADLRYILMRLRENAESVAFFQGAPVEKERCEFFFVRALSARYKKLLIESGYHSFLGVMQHVSFFVSFIPLAPLYFDGTVSYGAMSQAHMLFMHIEKSMFDFTRNLDKIAGLGAQAVRVIDLWDAIERYDKANRKAREIDDDASTDAGESSDEEDRVLGNGSLKEDSDSDLDDDDRVRLVDLPSRSPERLVIKDLSLLPPVGYTPLLKHLSFSMCDQDSVLITGPSGTGKSTLLRVIGGLFARGSGWIHRTALKRSFFVPQNPYLYEGSLRENVLYPRGVDDLSDDETAELDVRITSILENLGIGYLVDRHGLDEGVEFDKILSGGEKQRLNFARVLARDPDDLCFVLLDEATSALDEANEDVAYQLLRQSVSCYISVGHRMNLKKFHTKQLMLEKMPEGGCTARMLNL